MYLMMQDINVEVKLFFVNINRRHKMSGIFNVGLESDIVDELEAEEITAGDLIESMESIDIADELAEVSDLEARLDAGEAAVAGLESAVKFGEALLSSDKDVTADVVNALSIATETAAITLGAGKETLAIGTESDSGAEAALSLGLEDMKGVLKKAWEAIKRVINKIVTAVTDLITKLRMKAKNLPKAYAKIVAKADKVEKSAKAEDFNTAKQSQIASKFLAIAARTNKKVSNDLLVSIGSMGTSDGGLDAWVSDMLETLQKSIGTAGGILNAEATDDIAEEVKKSALLADGTPADSTFVVASYGYDDVVAVPKAIDPKAAFGDKVGTALDEMLDTNKSFLMNGVTIEHRSVKDAKKMVDNIEVEVLTLATIKNNAFKKFFKTIQDESSTIKKVSSLVKSFNSAGDKITASMAKVAASHDDSLPDSGRAVKSLQKAQGSVLKGMINVTKETALNDFRNAVAVLSYMNASLGQYKSE